MRSRDRKAAALATALLLATPGGFAQEASPVAWEVVPNATDAWDLSVAGDSTVYLDEAVRAGAPPHPRPSPTGEVHS
ncbi:MAG: hypothetical protein AAFR95_18790, partial [Bacteroidota bacterium]